MKVGITFIDLDFMVNDYLNFLKNIKGQCDYLIIGLQLNIFEDRFNKKNSSHNLVERYSKLKDFQFVDEIVPYVTESDIEDILKSFKIDILLLSKKFKNEIFSVKHYCKKNKIKIYYN